MLAAEDGVRAADNLVIGIPRFGVLFGGCAVRPAESTTLGNVADADLTSWPRAIERVQARHSAARLVVPGQGAPAGAEPLSRTLALLGGRSPGR